MMETPPFKIEGKATKLTKPARAFPDQLPDVRVHLVPAQTVGMT